MTGMLTSEQERNWAIFAHLSTFLGWFTGIFSWVGPLVIWLVFNEKSGFVSRNAKEALNFQISLVIYAVAMGLLCFLLVGLLFAWFVFPLLVLLQLVFPIIAAVKANQGETWRHPLTIRLVR